MATGPIVGIGEILWDLLPSGPQPGGAPFNFAFHCHQLGHQAIIVSRVGDDELGRRLLAEVRSCGLSDEFIQIDPLHPTGTVQVQVDAAGQPTYTIVEDVAWDYLENTTRLEDLADQASAVCFGTLGRRSATSAQTIVEFTMRARRRPKPAVLVFDFNLRQPLETLTPIQEATLDVDWYKMNETEFAALGRRAKFEIPEWEKFWADPDKKRDPTLSCVTRGERGCTVFFRGERIDVKGVPVEVVDTIGAGDAFTAALLTQALEGNPLRQSLEFANRFAALVASRPGGTPRIDRAEVAALGQGWPLANSRPQ